MARLLLATFLLITAVQAQISSSEYVQRRSRAMEAIKHDILLVQANPSFSLFDAGFQQDPDFQYFTGLSHVPSAILVIDGLKRESWLFIPKKLSGVIGLAFTQKMSSPLPETGIEHVADWESFASYLDTRLKESSTIYISGYHWRGAEEVPAALDKNNTHGRLWSDIAARWSNVKIVSASSQLDALRSRLSPAEIEISRKVGQTSAQALLAGMKAVKPNQTQRNVEAEITRECFRAGADNVSFWPWAMSGPNAVFPAPFGALLDYRSLNREMRSGELVRLDVGCAVDHYRGDVGRTVPVSGKFSNDQREAWDIFIAAYQSGLRVIREGASSANVFAAWQAEARHRQPEAKSPLAKALIERMLSKEGSEYWQIHGVGLVESQPPSVFSAGMTVAFEPMTSVGDQAFYLEDTILITSTGYEILTLGLPYTADEIEQQMNPKTKTPQP